MKKISALALGLFMLTSGAPLTMSQEHMPKPPVAKKTPHPTKIHGEMLPDDYFWMREKSSPEVISYLEAENAYTDAVMKPTQEFQKRLYDEMLGRIKQTDLSVPYREGEYYYYSRTEEGKQYPILCRKKGSLTGTEEVMLDLNEMAKGHKFLSLGSVAVSNDGGLLAYSTDFTGFRQYTLQFKDLRTGKLFSEKIEKTTSVVWAADNKTVFYGTEDEAKRPYRIYRHQLGANPTGDQVVYEEKDELYRVYAGKTRSRAHVLLVSSSSTTSEVRYISAAQPTAAPKVIVPRQEGHEYYVDHRGDLFYIRTNDQGKNFRLVTASVSDPERKNWKEVVPHRGDSMLEDIDCFANHLVLTKRENALIKLHIIDLRTNKAEDIPFPEPVYIAGLSQNPEFNTARLRYSYQSFTTPSSVYDYDIAAHQSELLKRTEVLGGYDPQRYTSERIYATAKDGVKVPISIVYRRDLKRNTGQPLVLNGYGSYGIPQDVTFSSSRISLLDRGVIYAIAHIRGGGDLGKDWHDQGKMMVKKNTFTDFIAAAETLIDKKYTASDRLIITGGSAGGLLTGAVVNMRPDLFKAVVSYVPFVDVMNTMLDASLPLTVQEYLEWGNPNEKPAYDYMKSYSPYDNIERKAYPAMLIKTSLNDSQVMYWEPAKYVAKLRTLKTDNNVLLFKTNMAAGHGGSSGRYDALKETAFDYAFILNQFGITK
jgi:oligopeptidase B